MCCVCVANVLLMCCLCIANVLLMCCLCVASVLLMCCLCVANVFLMCCLCVASVLLMCCLCVANVLLLCWDHWHTFSKVLSTGNSHSQHTKTLTFRMCSFLGHELGANSEGSYTNHDLDDFVLDGSLSSGVNVSLMCC